MRQFKMREVRSFSISDGVVRRGPRHSDLPVHDFELEVVGVHRFSFRWLERNSTRFGKPLGHCLLLLCCKHSLQ
jgi:hypothetical protein